MKQITERVIEERRHILIERDDLIEFLKSKGVTVDCAVEFSVRVPGGGDWSNTDLRINEDVDGIDVRYTVRKFE